MMRSSALKQLLVLVLVLLPFTTQAAKKSDKKSKGKQEQTGEGVLQSDAPSYSDRVLDSFLSFYEMGLDEKLYLQTDKNYYSSGEQIWFKGYLVDAITHAPLNFSNFIYVELADRGGKVVSRVKVRREVTGFDGHIVMDPMIEPGDYTLRAYTKWIANKSTEFFHSKNIKIVSAITTSAESKNPNQKALIKATAKLAEEAEAAVKAEQKMKYAVQFFPEGGSLLANTSQIVAFKALAEDGLSTEVSGTIYDSKGEFVTTIESSYKGMGIFQLMSRAGESYTAKLQATNGQQMTFKLPAVETQGVAIKVSRIGDKIFYQVITNEPRLLKDAHVVVHSRGQIITAADATLQPASMPCSMLRSGVTTFAVVDGDDQVMSERLIFNKPASLPTMSFKSSAENFAKRSLASFRVSLADESGTPIKGEFAVSVTDDSTVKGDPAKDNMLSYLLLSSEIRGHVEDPGLYFEEDNSLWDHRLDLLMRTQAWRRFDLAQVLKRAVPKAAELYENVAFISGQVKGFFGNQARRPKVAVFCSKVNYFDGFELDESSKFRLVGLNIPDSTTYIIKVQGRNGGNALSLNVDPELFPVSSPAIFSREERAAPPDAFVNQSKDKFFYEGGMQTIELESISVTTNKRAGEDTGVFVTQSSSREDLETMSAMSLRDLILTYVGMSISTDEETGETDVYYRSESEPVSFYVDGADTVFDSVSTLMADNIEQIDFFTGADAAAFSDASGGVIAITLREASGIDGLENPNIAFVSQLGYQHPAKFFQPSYEIASVRASWPTDLRTTIFWDGAIKPDDYGNINFGFYTADKATTYTVTIEGITDKGEICRGTTTVERTLK